MRTLRLGGLAVNFTATPTSPGVFSLVANGIGNMSHVGNVFFELHKTTSVPTFLRLPL
jgi:hypothetical protein